MSDDGDADRDADRDADEQVDIQRAIDRLENDGADASDDSAEAAGAEDAAGADADRATDSTADARPPDAESTENDAATDETTDDSTDETTDEADATDEMIGEADGSDETTDEADATDETTPAQPVDAPDQPTGFVPRDVAEYDRFEKIDGGTYERANEFLRDRTYVTAREWAIARLCADFRTETGVEMTKIGEHLPELVPFMTDTYSPQAVNEARASFEEKVRMAGATFLYGAMSGFFTADELDDLMYEATEVAKFLLEVEGVELSVEEELETEERISSVMREVRESSTALRHDAAECPECGHEFDLDGA